jgi:spermidine/putrescine transport system substrate-binding protein
MNDRIDPAIFRGLTQNRRGFLRLAGLAGAGAAIAACGVKGQKVAAPKQDDVAKYWAGKTGKGHVNFANWAAYMDPKQPELKEFTKQTGISVTYKEVINDMPSWFTKIQPQIAAGQSIGYDLMVVTNGLEFIELVQLGDMVPLDHSKLPNFTKYASQTARAESYDTGNVYSIPWATGMTGIAYNPKYVTTPPTSMADLWNPKYKGKVGMFSDPQEIGNFGMFAIGVDPEKSTPADWQKAAAKLKEQQKAGVIRKYYDQGYLDPLAKGDIWMCQAWSGDIFQKNLEGANLKFVIPSEGGTIWTDNMAIPKTAENPVDAIKLMDFFYDPKIAASLTEYISYVTAVPSAKDIIGADAAKATGTTKKNLETVATSPLVFPSDADLAKLKRYRNFKDEAEKKQYVSIFQPITTS